MAFVVRNHRLIARSPTATAGDARHMYGIHCLFLMLLAAVFLDDLAGEFVRDVVASTLGLVGILLLVSDRG